MGDKIRKTMAERDAYYKRAGLMKREDTDFGSPKEPMFPEAVIIYYADELSSKTAEMIEFKNMALEETEDDFMFHKRYSKNILLK